jgi:hypothetical protein
VIENTDVQGGSNMTGTDLRVNKTPTTSLFFKRASGYFQNVEKNVLTPEGSTLKTGMCK